MLFDFQHSGNLRETFLVLLDVVLMTLQSVDVGLNVANTNLQLAHFPGPVALKFFHIFLQLRTLCLGVCKFVLCGGNCQLKLFHRILELGDFGGNLGVC